MLLHDDVVTDREAKPGAFSGGLRREERIKHLYLHVRRNTDAVIADADLHAVAEVLGRRCQGRLVVAAIHFHLMLGRRVEAVGDKVEKRPRNVLRKDVNLTALLFDQFVGALLKTQRHVEAECLGCLKVLVAALHESAYGP